MNDSGLTLEYERIGKNGKVRLTARLAGTALYTDKVDLADATGRERFLRGLAKNRKGINRQAVAAELERIVGELVAKPDSDDADGKDGDGKGRRSQADVLVQLAEVAELFHTPGGHDSEGYATVPVGDHRETWPIASKGFRRWLSRLYYLDLAKAPGAQALQDAVNVLAGMAIHDGAERPVAVRVAEQAGAIYLDLADPEWRAVEVTAAGWRVVADPPVRFCRRRGQLALPVPVPGGTVDELRGLVNVPDDDAWRLLIGWLIAALRPGRPFPILVVNGEQGSAKSTLCRMARALIDPNEAALRRPPRDDRDLMIAAHNAWVVGLDNLSGLSAALSDALCSLATGGGFATRELYSDGDEKLFAATRPVMVNGIDEVATRSDLLDRSIGLTLPVIPDDARQEEDSLWPRFAAAQPRILGALLSAVSAALASKGKVRLTAKPRMADFAAWVVAAEPALDWPSGAFLAAYLDNRATANTAVLEESVLAPLIVALLTDRDRWHGTAKELLAELEGRADERTKKRKDWPSTPRKLSGDLRRLAPNLRRGAGIEVRFERDSAKSRARIIELERSCKSPSEPSDTVRTPDFGPKTGPSSDGRPDGTDGRPDGSAPYRPTKTPENTGFCGRRTVSDGTDGILQPHSGLLWGESPGVVHAPDDDEEVAEWTG